MEKINKACPLIFIHIPKAGGNTLRYIIQRQYNNTDLYYDGHDFDRWHSFKQKTQADYHYDFIGGHIYFGFHQFLPNENAKYLTMLRHPIQRIVSLFNFIKSGQAQNWLQEDIGKLNFSDYIRSGLEVDIENSQTRRLAGIDYSYSNLPFGSCNQSVLEIALDNINNYFVTPGVLEYFNESILLWQHELGWSFPFHYRLNETKKNFISYHEISKEDKKYLLELNEFDLNLLNIIQASFLEKISQIPYLRFKLTALKYSTPALTFLRKRIKSSR